MKHLGSDNSQAFQFRCLRLDTACVAVLLLACSVERMAASSADGHLPVRVPGGMPAEPFFTSIARSNGQVTLNWRGFAGPYQVLQKTNLASDSWQNVGRPTRQLSATVPGNLAGSFFGVSGPVPGYLGSVGCAECHGSIYAEETNTSHATALETLKRIHQQNNASCLPCHVVGYGVSTGFQNETATPHLAGVQCENCHGPAEAHAANPIDPASRPVREISSMLCGGCHTGDHHPTYEEWEGSAHAHVTEELVEEFNTTNLVANTNRMNTCGPCHSGSVRLSLLESEPLPSGHEAGAIAASCVICHDPHARTPNGEQLRNPVYSTNFYSYSTSVAFSNQYNPDINICGQCHNARGARWQDTARPPHYSPQYNMMLGNIGVTTNATPPSSPHWRLSGQCVTCHMQTKSYAEPTPDNPNVTGHLFEVESFEVCSDCHADPQGTMEATQFYVSDRINTIKGLLDQWATTKAPAALRTKYGPLAWEYTAPGPLSNPTGDPAVVGPTAGEQTSGVPVPIREARFNLYLVYRDGSLGVHNAAHFRYLLRVAEGKVNGELAK
jgi:hypothetical protein